MPKGSFLIIVQKNSELKDDFLNFLCPFIDEEDFDITMGNKDQIIANIDELLEYFIKHLSSLNQFGLPQTGFGFISKKVENRDRFSGIDRISKM